MRYKIDMTFFYCLSVIYLTIGISILLVFVLLILNGLQVSENGSTLIGTAAGACISFGSIILVWSYVFSVLGLKTVSFKFDKKPIKQWETYN